MQEVKIVIDTEGNATVSVVCGDGPSCAALTADIEKALGVVTKDTKTSDFYKKPKLLVSQK